ncbi:helix-turn-helix domain-containing protein [Clostridium tyrobutyricum]|uniref:helix-turn-helix domain-containing protein n=1 Tax=Clostridium tyrobutyricum TaxID=1519 RepID=UPI00057D76C6|nr:XRE family transcriptional regulator [Clostridium tyrobutyricum]
MDVTSAIAKNMKQLREKRKLSLDAAASLTGVSRSMLAQIEKGDVNPTISVLWKIANGLKVSFSSLVEREASATSVIPNETITPLVEDEGRYINYPIFPFDEKKLFESYRIVIKPKGFLSASPHLEGTEEYLTVFAGEVEIGTGEEAYLLKTGDSIRFKADTEHHYKNIGAETVQLNMLIYYNK